MMALFLLRLRKLFYALKSKLGRGALRHGVAASIEHLEVFRQANYATIIDIGANKGQFALLMRGLLPRAQIESFEPIESCNATFQSIFADDKHTRLHPVAIGPDRTTSSIYIAAEDDSSSLLAPGKNQEAIFGTKVVAKQTITVQPLDTELQRESISSPALLKMDVQGFELSALKGSQSLLDCFDEIYVECSYVELYEGQALVGEIMSYLSEQNFHLKGVFNQFVEPGRGAVQADFLFSRIAFNQATRA